MSNPNHFFASLLCAFLATLLIRASSNAEDAWTENISQAILKAAEEDKDQLLLWPAAKNARQSRYAL